MSRYIAAREDGGFRTKSRGATYLPERSDSEVLSQNILSNLHRLLIHGSGNGNYFEECNCFCVDTVDENEMTDGCRC